MPESPVNTEVTFTAIKGDKVFPNVRANNVQALKDMGFTVTENKPVEKQGAKLDEKKGVTTHPSHITGQKSNLVMLFYGQ